MAMNLKIRWIIYFFIVLATLPLCQLLSSVRPDVTPTPKIVTQIIDGTPPVLQTTSAPPLFALESRSDGARRISNPDKDSSDQNPAISPDGNRLVLTRFANGYNDGPAGLFLLDLHTGNLNPLTPAEDQDNVNLPGAAWNAANDSIVFASDREDASDLWRINYDGSNLHRITRHGQTPWYLEPSWSPDGQWIVFELRQPGESEDGWVGQIWAVQANGNGLRQLTRDIGQDDRQPNWSPDGKQILFQRRALPDGQWDLFTITPFGEELFNLSNTLAASETDASWSPSSAWIVCSSDYGGLPFANLFIYQAHGGSPSQLTASTNHEDGAPSWSPDGNWIVFESHLTSEDTPSSLWWIAVPNKYLSIRR